MTSEKTQPQEKIQDESIPELSLILFNDDINSFDYVVDALIEVCEHDPLQAEQCTLIAHHNGKCAVKNGTIEELKEMCKALQDRGLSSIIQ
jgi:ATP-dependent Clp protease adaptor protein ClpS